jgi:hypothetical protein
VELGSREPGPVRPGGNDHPDRLAPKLELGSRQAVKDLRQVVLVTG